MLLALGCLTLLALTLASLIFYLLRSIREERAQWLLERRELLNRIQRPEQLPVGHSEPLVLPDPEPDEIGQVGEIVYSEHYGLED